MKKLIKYVDRQIIVEYQGTFDAICEERLNLLK